MIDRYVGPGIQPQAAEMPASFDDFRAAALASGCYEVLVREWKPDLVLETHTHDFDAEAVVVQGEMWLEEGGRRWHLQRGASFCLPALTPHAEHYGPAGATFWVGRRKG